MKQSKILLSSLVVILLISLCCAGTFYFFILAPQFHPQHTSYIYIDRNDNVDSILYKVKKAGCPQYFQGFIWMAQYKKLNHHIHTGKYIIRPNENVYHVYSRISRGYQTPVNLTINSTRTLDVLARNIGKQLMIDSAEIAKQFNDSLTQERLGYRSATFPCLFIPNTYEVYWNVSVDKLLERLQKEHNKFWTAKRRTQAANLHMTIEEVTTLASIVEEETNNQTEKPMVAGLYINRLQRGMPLQADPTVKFALKEFGLRRITNKHLQTVSPYNTYLNTGLPPGPIRIASPAGIDAVLNYTKHNFLYMCAKEDFSGTHNFATNLAAHTRNAQKYWNALNKRKIFK